MKGETTKASLVVIALLVAVIVLATIDAVERWSR